MRRISWQWLQRIAVLIAFGLLVGLVAIGQRQRPNTPPTETQEEDAREAAFLYLFDVGTGPDLNYSIYCLSINRKVTDWGDDPSDELMKRFRETPHTLRKLSECETSKDPKDLMSSVTDKKTGKFAWIVSVSSIDSNWGRTILRRALRVALHVEGDAGKGEMEGRYRSGCLRFGFIVPYSSPQDGNLSVERKSLISFLR